MVMWSFGRFHWVSKWNVGLIGLSFDVASRKVLSLVGSSVVFEHKSAHMIHVHLLNSITLSLQEQHGGNHNSWRHRSQYKPEHRAQCNPSDNEHQSVSLFACAYWCVHACMCVTPVLSPRPRANQVGSEKQW